MVLDYISFLNQFLTTGSSPTDRFFYQIQPIRSAYKWRSVDDKGSTWVSKGGKGRERYNLTKSRGGEKRVNYHKFEIATKLRKT